ncbi:hypothetical protein AB0M83_17685 [Amycolatopsis sp. NPDC051106]|uniref:hypothetical protein n=1 Tax=unclassified Amycolatopsis TaxID=2618356 RepID=UPI003431B9A2
MITHPECIRWRNSARTCWFGFLPVRISGFDSTWSEEEAITESFTVGIGTSVVEGAFAVPVDAAGVVVLLTVQVIRGTALQPGGRPDHRFARLLFDMLSEEEDRAESAGGRRRFDIGLLRDRSLRALDDLGHHPAVAGLPVGLFGASTGRGCRAGGCAVRCC